MPYTKLPKDPVILISFINTQLRDNYSDLDSFCAAYQADKNEIVEYLADYDYEYDEALKRFQ